jgi:hypothetical protein
MGYLKFVRWTSLDAAIKYAKYRRFLPMLLGFTARAAEKDEKDIWCNR